MQQELLIAVLAGLGGMLGWGFADFFAKKTIDELGDIMTLAWAGVFGSVTFLIVILCQVVIRSQNFDVPRDPLTWFALVFFGALQGAVYIFVYRGFAKGQVGILSPLFASFAGIVSLVSILFLGETAGPYRILALFVTFIGVMILNAEWNVLSSLKLGFSKVEGFGDVAIGTGLAAVWTILWERFVSGADWLFYAFYMFMFMTIFVFLFARFQRLPFNVKRIGLWKLLAAIGVCETVAYLAISFGYGMTSLVSVVAILSAAFSLPTIILARIFLKEHTTMIQKVGTVVILIGVVLLAAV